MKTTKKATFYVDKDILKSLKYQAISEGKTISYLLNQILDQSIDDKYKDISILTKNNSN
jgi:hypothetical protein